MVTLFDMLKHMSLAHTERLPFGLFIYFCLGYREHPIGLKCIISLSPSCVSFLKPTSSSEPVSLILECAVVFFCAGVNNICRKNSPLVLFKKVMLLDYFIIFCVLSLIETVVRYFKN